MTDQTQLDRAQERAFELQVKRIERNGRLFEKVVQYGAWCIIAYCGYLSIDSVAGETTFVNVLVQVLGNVTISKWLAYAFGAGGLSYGTLERKRRQRINAQKSTRIKELEERIDPNRSSSNLPPKGVTRPEDE